MPATMIDLQYRLARALYDVVLGDAEDWDQTWEDAYRAERASIIASMPAEAGTSSWQRRTELLDRIARNDLDRWMLEVVEGISADDYFEIWAVFDDNDLIEYAHDPHRTAVPPVTRSAAATVLGVRVSKQQNISEPAQETRIEHMRAISHSAAKLRETPDGQAVLRAVIAARDANVEPIYIVAAFPTWVGDAAA
jgi:hypothetical protein